MSTLNLNSVMTGTIFSLTTKLLKSHARKINAEPTVLVQSEYTLMSPLIQQKVRIH